MHCTSVPIQSQRGSVDGRRQWARGVSHLVHNHRRVFRADRTPPLHQVVLSLERGVWAPNLHFSSPNTDIPALSDGRLRVVDRPIPVRRGIVGVNSFGFGGSNVHVILRPPTDPPQPAAAAEVASGPRLLQACGRTEEAVASLLAAGRQGERDDSFLSLLNEVSGLPVAAMPFRGYTLVGSAGEVTEVQQASATPRPLWYICSG